VIEVDDQRQVRLEIERVRTEDLPPAGLEGKRQVRHSRYFATVGAGGNHGEIGTDRAPAGVDPGNAMAVALEPRHLYPGDDAAAR